MVVGASMKLKKTYIIRILKFRGALPYPVDFRFLAIFIKGGNLILKFSVNLSEEELILLNNFMKQNNIKSKSAAIRKCIKIATNLESRIDLLLDINNKLNRIIYRENIQKKLLEQFYANMEFPVDQDVKTEAGLVRFYKNNNFYLNKIMD